MKLVHFKFVTCLAVAIFVATVDRASADRSIDTRFVSGADDVPLAVFESGKKDAPGILFLHGFSQGALSFKQQLDSDLADDFHLVSFDFRGHGNSGKPWATNDYTDDKWVEDIELVVAATQLERPLIVAWSFAGDHALSYVRLNGMNNISGLVLVGTLGGLETVSVPDSELESMMLLAPLTISPSLAENEIAARAFVDFLTFREVPSDWADRAYLLSLMVSSNVRVALDGLRNTQSGPVDNSDLFSEMTVPVLIVCGSEDWLAPKVQTESVVARLPVAKSVIFDGVGHSPFVEDPQRFNAELRDFAETVFAGN